jgi:hypothetical protein
MDLEWRHAVLEGALNEFQMQGIDDCMQEVATQMQTQILQRQQIDDIQKHHQIEHLHATFDRLSEVEQTEGEFYESMDCCEPSDAACAVASDVLFQAKILALLTNT